MFGPGSGSVTEDELLCICMQGHTCRDTDALTQRPLKTYSSEKLFFLMLQCVTGVNRAKVTDRFADSVSTCQFIVLFWFDF